MPSITELSHHVSSIKFEIFISEVLLKLNGHSLSYLNTLTELEKNRKKLTAQNRQEYVQAIEIYLKQIHLLMLRLPSLDRNVKLVTAFSYCVPIDFDLSVCTSLMSFKVGCVPKFKKNENNCLFSDIMEEMIRLPREIQYLKNELQKAEEIENQESLRLLQEAVSQVQGFEKQQEESERQMRDDRITTLLLAKDPLLDVGEDLVPYDEEFDTLSWRFSSRETLLEESQSPGSLDRTEFSSPQSSQESLSSTLKTETEQLPDLLQDCVEAVNASTKKLMRTYLKGVSLWVEPNELRFARISELSIYPLSVYI